MTVLFIATVACIISNAFIAVADYRRAGFVLKNSAEVGVPANALPYLATLKLLGALGLVLGVVVFPWLGVAAAIGLVLFFCCAMTAHLKARVFYNIAFPGVYLLLSIASLIYLLDVAGSS